MENSHIKNDYILIDSGDIAKQRLYDYLDEKLRKETGTAKWEFFNFLLKQAKRHEIYPYATIIKKDESLEYQKDEDEIRRYWDKKLNPEKQEERRSFSR
jgi:hypothetical protein